MTGYEVSIVDAGRLGPVVKPFKSLIHRFNRWIWGRYIGKHEAFHVAYDRGQLAIERRYDPSAEDPTDNLDFTAGIIGMFAYMFPVSVAGIGLVVVSDLLGDVATSGLQSLAAVAVVLMGTLVLVAAADCEYEIELTEVRT